MIVMRRGTRLRLDVSTRAGDHDRPGTDRKQRDDVREAETESDALVHAKEFNTEAERTSADKIASQHDRIGDALPAPPDKAPTKYSQADCFVELGWMHR